MPLIVHRSADAEDLAEALAAVLASPVADPFAVDLVAVHSGGLQQWLAMRIAHHNGICAAIRFPHPNELVGELAAAVLGVDAAERSPWATGRLLWALVAILGGLRSESPTAGLSGLAALPAAAEAGSGGSAAAAASSLSGLAALPAAAEAGGGSAAAAASSLSELRSYILAGGPADEALRTITLAQRLANVFQAYGTYRPELVERWREPRAEETWEAPLWRALEARLGSNHLTAWAERLARLPRREGGVPAGWPRGRICVFSVSTLPPLLIRVLADLADLAPIHVFALHPSPAAWAARAATAAPPAHPLLQTMGTLSQHLQDSLTACGDRVEHHLLPAAPPRRDSVLHRLQADLFEDRPPSLTGSGDQPVDGSLQIHSCTSPLRQVHALHGALLELFDTVPDLEPRDVVVMCPDIETFAPLVEAVFTDGAPSWAHATGAADPIGFPRLPFRLADRGVRSVNHAAEALLRVLDLADSRLEVGAVLDLLSLEPVRERFGLAADQLALARDLLTRGGVRWGADSAHRARADLPADDRFTWRFALDRLLLGHALADPAHALVLGHAPDREVEGDEERQVLGGLVDFAESLLAECEALQAPRTPAEWLVRLVETTDRLITDPAERGWQKRQVLDTLAELGEQAASTEGLGPIDLRTVRILLQGRFAAREPGRGFLDGAITVCQLVPLRSIPFRVICLLGLDDQAYPRVEPRPGYDQMALDRRPGDRDARRDDRSLFLEALTSARDALLITCTGLSERTGRELPTSVPVAELLQVVPAGVVRRHPLQPWSPALFGGAVSHREWGSAGASRLAPTSHDRRMAAAWERGRREPSPVPTRFAEALPPAEDWPRELTLGELVRFWRHPPSDLVRRRLGLRLREEEVELEDAVPDTLDGLAAWAIRDRALADGLAGESLEPGGEVARRILRGGVVSLGTPGRLQTEGALAPIRALLRAASALLAEPRDPIDVDVGQALRVSGRVTRIFAAGRVVLQAGRIRGRHKLDAWLHHLALHSHGWTGPTTLLGADGGWTLPPLDRREANRLLRPFGLRFLGSQSVPVLFWADVSHDWLRGARAEEEPEKAARAGFRASQAAWERRSEGERLVDGWMLGHANPFQPSARTADLLPAGTADPLELARELWGPALDQLREVAP